jgi:hypothetical protein
MAQRMNAARNPSERITSEDFPGDASAKRVGIAILKHAV